MNLLDCALELELVSCFDLLAKIEDDGPALDERQSLLLLQEPVQSSGQQKDKGRTELADLGYSLCFLWDFLEQLHFLPSWCLPAPNRSFGPFRIPDSNVQQLVLLEQVVDIPLPLFEGVLRRRRLLFP